MSVARAAPLDPRAGICAHRSPPPESLPLLQGQRILHEASTVFLVAVPTHQPIERGADSSTVEENSQRILAVLHLSVVEPDPSFPKPLSAKLGHKPGKEQQLNPSSEVPHDRNIPLQLLACPSSNLVLGPQTKMFLESHMDPIHPSISQTIDKLLIHVFRYEKLQSRNGNQCAK